MYSQDLDLLRLVAEVRAPAMVPCLCLNTVQEEGLLLVGWGAMSLHQCLGKQSRRGKPGPWMTTRTLGDHLATFFRFRTSTASG